MITINTKKLINTLDIFTKAVHKEKSMLKCNRIAIKTNKNDILFRMGKGKYSIDVNIPYAKPTRDTFNCSVDFKLLKNAVTLLKKAPNLDLELIENKLRITENQITRPDKTEVYIDRSQLKSIEIEIDVFENAPSPVKMDKVKKEYVVDFNELQHNIKTTVGFIAKEELKRDYLLGVAMRVLKNSLYFIGTDGARLSKNRLQQVETEKEPFDVENGLDYDVDFNIPVEVCNSLLKVKGGRFCCIQYDGGTLNFIINIDDNPNCVVNVRTRRNADEVIEYNRVIPQDNQHKATFNRKRLVETLDLLNINKYRHENIFLELTNDKLFMHMVIDGKETSKISNDIIEGTVNDLEHINILNITFLKELLKTFKSELVTFQIADSKMAPIVITGNQEELTTVIMPKRG